MTLHDHLPRFLLNPAFVFVSICAGLGLLYLSHQQQLQRILTQPSQLVGVDKYRKDEKPGWLLPLVWVFSVALVVTPLLALAYSLAYKGTPPIEAHIPPQPICKTADCWPRPSGHGHHQPINISAPNGNAIGPVSGTGNIIAPNITNNFAPPERHLTKEEVAELSAFIGRLPQGVQVNILTIEDTETQVLASEIKEALKVPGDRYGCSAPQ